MSRKISLSIWSFALLCFFIGEIWLSSRMGALNKDLPQINSEQGYAIPSKIVKIATAGFLPAVVDWIWVHCLITSGSARVKKGEHPGIFYDLDLLTDLDPLFFDPYFSGANLLAIARGDIPGSLHILKKGDSFLKNEFLGYSEAFRNRYWRGAWALSMTLAYVYLFELSDMPNAALAFKDSARLPFAPPFLHSLAARLEKSGGEYEVGLRLLSFMILSAQESRLGKRAIDELEEKRRSLYISQYLFEINRSFLEFLNQQATYRSSDRVLVDQIKRYWRKYKEKKSELGRDPFGGELFIDQQGRIDSSTPRISVFGLR